MNILYLAHRIPYPPNKGDKIRSLAEALLFKQRVKDRPISFIRNGVDLNYFNPNGSTFRRTSDPIIVFTGMMDYFPNVDAVRYFTFRIARGTQNKILEALAMGVPVVATSEACEGIGDRSGEGLLVADNPSDFAHHVIEVLRNDSVRQLLSERARRRMEQEYNWDDRICELEKVLLMKQEKRHKI